LLAWVLDNGHCFFDAVAALLNSKGANVKYTSIDVRRAAVQEMRGPHKRKYQELWYTEHIGKGKRTLPDGALS
jgi:hypothetical protein